jgi:hypothetical protein
MNKYLLLLAVISFPALAWDDPDIEKRSNRSSNYESRFGNEYQYDLSRPSDQLRYETDVRAQMRDELDTDPRRELERDLGQHGGGKVKRRRY